MRSGWSPSCPDHHAAGARPLNHRSGAGLPVNQQLHLRRVERRLLDNPADHPGRRNDRHVLAQPADGSLVDGDGLEQIARCAPATTLAGERPQRRPLAAGPAALELGARAAPAPAAPAAGPASPSAPRAAAGSPRARRAGRSSRPRSSRTPPQHPRRAELHLREEPERDRLQHPRARRRYSPARRCRMIWPTSMASSR